MQAICEGALDLPAAARHRRIHDLPSEWRATLAEAENRVGRADAGDAPYVAVALALRGQVWSLHQWLARRTRIPYVTTKDLLTLME